MIGIRHGRTGSGSDDSEDIDSFSSIHACCFDSENSISV